MLPTLRQYAFLSTLLEKSFDTKMTEIITPREAKKDTVTTTTIRDDYASFMADNHGNTYGGSGSPGEGGNDASADMVFMDVVLTAHPVPRLQVVFPFRGATADIMLEIRANGLVHVVSQNIIDDAAGYGDVAGKGKGKQMTPQDLGRLLEVCEDLGQWCAWIRSRCS